jgi:hypothetical protein
VIRPRPHWGRRSSPRRRGRHVGIGKPRCGCCHGGRPRRSLDLDRSEVVPIDVREGEVTPIALKHGVERPRADLGVVPPNQMAGVVVVAKAEVLQCHDGEVWCLAVRLEGEEHSMQGTDVCPIVL